MSGHDGLVLWKRPVTLVGRQTEVGAKVPNFVVDDEYLSPVAFSSYLGKPCVLCSLVSVDREVCAAHARQFNEQAAGGPAEAQSFVISMDLPFALRRWGRDVGASRVKLLSDHRDASFGTSYGVLVREFRLLAPAVFVVDVHGVLRYKQFAQRADSGLDYGAAFAALRRCL